MTWLKENWVKIVKNLFLLLCLYVVVVLILRTTIYCGVADLKCQIRTMDLPPVFVPALPITILIAYVWSKLVKKFDL